MIEQLITELTEAVKANTAALNAVLAQAGKPAADPAPETTKPEPAKPGRPKGAKAAPQPEPAAEETTDTETPDPAFTPTKVSTKPTADDTPHVSARTEPGHPAAGEHVDVDEVIAQIQATVKAKLISGDTEAVKAEWAAYRKGLGVDRIGELRNEPAKLLAALTKAKSL